MNPSIPRPPIVSLSLNPAIDLTYQVPTLIHDQKSRATATHYDPGGTGINVGRALETLTSNTHTCYITAGKTGEMLDSLIAQELKNTYSLKVNGETRINTTIMQQSPKQQYQVNDLGPAITHIQLEEIIEQFLTLCKQGIGILTGSLPLGIADSTYAEINSRLKQQGGRAIIDAPVNILKQTLNGQPFLIKPNLHELETLCQKSLTSIESVAAEARDLTRLGIEHVCISLAEKGAILTTSENSHYCQSPDIIVASTVGAGDSMVAGLAYSLSLNTPLKEALKFAVACGTGTARQPGTQLFKPEELAQLASQVTVKTLDI